MFHAYLSTGHFHDYVVRRRPGGQKCITAPCYLPHSLPHNPTTCPYFPFLQGFGVWIGPTALYASSYVDRVLALEPDPAAFSALQEVLRVNPECSLKSTTSNLVRCQTLSHPTFLSLMRHLTLHFLVLAVRCSSSWRACFERRWCKWLFSGIYSKAPWHGRVQEVTPRPGIQGHLRHSLGPFGTSQD